MGAPQDDRGLAEAVVRGEPGAAEALFERVFEPLYRQVCRRLGGDHHAAEDVVGETLLSGLPALRGFRGEARLESWFFAIAARKIVDRHRRRAAEIVAGGNGDLDALLRAPARGGGDPADALAGEETRASVRGALEALPEAHRSVLSWRYCEDRSLVEVAEMLRVSPKAAERRLARARLALASELRRRRVEP
jgi:RNA polymerase sigma-70 factor (ECF subfamily)